MPFKKGEVVMHVAEQRLVKVFRPLSEAMRGDAVAARYDVLNRLDNPDPNVLEFGKFPSPVWADDLLSLKTAEKAKKVQDNVILMTALGHVFLEVHAKYLEKKKNLLLPVTIAGSDISHVATLLAVKRGIVSAKFDPFTHELAEAFGVTLPEHKVSSTGSTISHALKNAGIITHVVGGFVRTGKEFVAFTPDDLKTKKSEDEE
jgi:hypothetical protein